MAGKLEQSFKRIDQILYNDGIGSHGDYIEQISWILFLKYLEDLEKRRQTDAALNNKKIEPILKPEFAWGTWASPKNDKGEKDVTKALVGKDLVEFVDDKLFPYLQKFKTTTENTKTIQYKIGEIFSEVRNKITNGSTLREAIDIIDELEFKTQEQLDDLSHLYESRLKLLGGAGRSGEFYTPRPLIKTIIKAIDPEPGKTIYDGAAGTGGFLTEAFDYLKAQDLSVKQLKFLKEETFVGKNKAAQPYLLGTMNMILHGIEAPEMIHTDTLVEDTADIQEKDRFDYILANPPFGGGMRKEVRRNFQIESGETAYLFLQHFIKMLRAGGEAAIVIKNTFLSNGDAAPLRKELLESCDLHTVLDLPAGTFSANSSTGVKTVVLFFKKGSPTKKTWYYKLDPGRSLGKTDPLNEKDFAEFLKLYKKKSDSQNSWSLKVSDLDEKTFDLSVKNPNKEEEEELRSPKEIIKSLQKLDKEAAKILSKLQ
jgi:type I restriction enzyme M protein